MVRQKTEVATNELANNIDPSDTHKEVKRTMLENKKCLDAELPAFDSF